MMNSLWENIFGQPKLSEDEVAGIVSPTVLRMEKEMREHEETMKYEELKKRVIQQQNMMASMAPPPPNMGAGSSAGTFQGHIAQPPVTFGADELVKNYLGGTVEYEVHVRQEFWDGKVLPGQMKDEADVLICVDLRHRQTREILRFDEPRAVFPSPELQTKLRLLRK